MEGGARYVLKFFILVYGERLKRSLAKKNPKKKHLKRKAVAAVTKGRKEGCKQKKK